MANVYSTVFYSTPAAVTSGVPVVHVPGGVIYIIRDVLATNTQRPPLGLWGVSLYSLLTGSLTPNDQGGWFAGVEYHWEMRQVLEAGDNLYVSTIDSDWTLRVSGYVLSLP